MQPPASASSLDDQAADTNGSSQLLHALAGSVHDCRLCRLCHDRRHAVPGTGNASADIMFVAEAPGYHEDRSGSALVGAAGRLFDDVLSAIDLQRSDVWITTVLKCRTPRSRSPFPDEIEQCEGFLFREIALVQPRVICALGNTAVRVLTGRSLHVGKAHGTPLSAVIGGRDTIILPLFHPAAVVQVPPLLPMLLDDSRQIPRLLRDGMPSQPAGGGRVEQALREPSPQQDAAADQLSLGFG